MSPSRYSRISSKTNKKKKKEKLAGASISSGMRKNAREEREKERERERQRALNFHDTQRAVEIKSPSQIISNAVTCEN